MNPQRITSIITIAALALLLTGCTDTAPEKTSQPGTPAEPKTEQPPKQPEALPVWQPIVSSLPDLSSGGQQRLADLYTSIDSPEDNPGIWSITGNGCSWYCGGEAHNVTASSTLPDQSSFTYFGNNAHDLSYDTAWVGGSPGPGIGESLTYTFTNQCPRITDIIILNGYIKDEDTWIKNNRVRTLELSINGEPIALLKLADTRTEQSFDLSYFGLGPLGRYSDGQPLILTFTIRGIYPGSTHDDTAITEIYFDGIDVH